MFQPQKRPRQFRLLALFTLVTQACLVLAAMRMLNADERGNLLIALAILLAGYLGAVLVSRARSRFVRK